MKQELFSMDSMVTTFKSIHNDMRQANLAQLDDVVKRFRSQDQEQSRNLEIIVSRLDADFAQLSADQVHSGLLSNLTLQRST